MIVSLSTACVISLSLCIRPPPSSTLFPYTTLFRSSPPQVHTLKVQTRFRIRHCRNVSNSNNFNLFFLTRRFLRSIFCRSEEHTSELQSRGHLVCRLLLEKKKKKVNISQNVLHLVSH